MKWLIAFVLIVFTLVGVGLWYLKDPGHVEIVWLGYEYKSTAVMSLLLFSCLFFFFVFAMSLVAWVFKMPDRIKSRFLHTSESKADKELHSLVTHFEAEKFTTAHYHQKRAAKTLSRNPFFLWFSGNLNLKTNNLFEAGQYFFEMKKTPSTAFLGLKGAIEAAIQLSDFKGAEFLLEEAEKIIPDSPWVIRTHLATAQKLHDVKKVEELSLRLQKLGHPVDLTSPPSVI